MCRFHTAPCAYEWLLAAWTLNFSAWSQMHNNPINSSMWQDVTRWKHQLGERWLSFHPILKLYLCRYGCRLLVLLEPEVSIFGRGREVVLSFVSTSPAGKGVILSGHKHSGVDFDSLVCRAENNLSITGWEAYPALLPILLWMGASPSNIWSRQSA